MKRLQQLVAISCIFSCVYLSMYASIHSVDDRAIVGIMHLPLYMLDMWVISRLRDEELLSNRKRCIIIFCNTVLQWYAGIFSQISVGLGGALLLQLECTVFSVKYIIITMVHFEKFRFSLSMLSAVNRTDAANVVEQSQINVIICSDVSYVPRDWICCVCLEGDNNSSVKRLVCNHCIHEECINQLYLHRHFRCPLCRA